MNNLGILDRLIVMPCIQKNCFILMFRKYFLWAPLGASQGTSDFVNPKN